MVQRHPITPDQRAQLAAYMIAHRGEYGLISRLSRELQLSRPTLYAWREQAQQALEQAFLAPSTALPTSRSLERDILTLWIAHASERSIQHCLLSLTGQRIGLQTISNVLRDAQQRALSSLASDCPSSTRALALDEIYGNDRQAAYLHAVDVHSGAVWAAAGPLTVDGESWTLLLWELRERGLQWERVVVDGGSAISRGCQEATPEVQLNRDQWHGLHSCGQIQARLARIAQQLAQRSPAVARQAARVESGKAPLGRAPTTDVVAHQAAVARAQRVVADVMYLNSELHRLLNVVVEGRSGLLSEAEREQELRALTELLAELVDDAAASQQSELKRLHKLVTSTLPEWLRFVPHLGQVQADLMPVLGAEQQALLGWAWLRRLRLGWSSRDIEQAVPLSWRAAARVLLASWEDAVRVSSAVERWHSIVRPHLAVRRCLSNGMLALLAVWHNHRVFRRGLHKGMSPLVLSGMSDAPADWLVALGYGPAEESASSTTPLALAA